MHIKTIFLYIALCCFAFSFPACNNEDDFKEVSKLIASRNTARYKKAENQKARKLKKPVPKKVEATNQDKKVTEKKKFSTEIFYEEEIKIISSSSNSTLGIGTAYMNKDGKIVQIKIQRN